MTQDRLISVAPMMDWTDRHCRYFMRLISPRAFLYTEMVTANAIHYGDARSLLRYDAAEHPIAIQLGGSDLVNSQFSIPDDPAAAGVMLFHQLVALELSRALADHPVELVLVGQADSEPCGGALRTSTWRNGDTIRDTVHLPVAEGTPPGSYQVATGFYTWPDITPLALERQDKGFLTTLEIR